MKPEEITLNVEGMSCNHCVQAVHRTLEEIEGLTDIMVDLDKKSARFKMDPQKSGSVDTVIAQVTNAGYPASLS